MSMGEVEKAKVPPLLIEPEFNLKKFNKNNISKVVNIKNILRNAFAHLVITQHLPFNIIDGKGITKFLNQLKEIPCNTTVDILEKSKPKPRTIRNHCVKMLSDRNTKLKKKVIKEK